MLYRDLIPGRQGGRFIEAAATAAPMPGEEREMALEVIHDLERVNLLRLPEFEIQSCRGCYRCLMEDQACPLEDDFYGVLAAITAADALVVAATVPILHLVALFQVFLSSSIVYTAALRGAGDTRHPLLFTLATLLLVDHPPVDSVALVRITDRTWSNNCSRSTGPTSSGAAIRLVRS